MKLRTLIIDDEPIALEKLKKYVERLSSLELVGTCGDGLEALSFLSDRKVDLIVTDINMPDLNGLEFIKSLNEPPMVIFTTAYAEYAVDGYKVSAVDYLLKPYGFAEFSNAVAKAVNLHNLISPVSSEKVEQKQDSMFVKVEHRYIRINLSDIIYIKGYGEYLQLFLVDAKNPLVTLSSFISIKEKLTPNFLQIHRSYIVNMNRVESIKGNRIITERKDELPVGESYKEALQEFLSNRSLGRKQ